MHFVENYAKVVEVGKALEATAKFSTSPLMHAGLYNSPPPAASEMIVI